MPRTFYVGWLAAAALAAVGAASDTSWHFAHLFDEFSLPHLVLGAGQSLYVALLLWALVLCRHQLGAAERTAIYIAATGIGIFLFVIPCDLIWHLIFGVDISTWSPTHLSLNYSSDLAHLGILAAWLSSPGARGPRAWVMTFVIGVATLLAVHYPLYQQEYGAAATAALLQHRAPWYVAPDMWVLTSPRALELVKGGAPDWLYVVYTALAVGYALALGASVLGRGVLARAASRAGRLGREGTWPWRTGAATAIALTFVLIRFAFGLAFTVMGMPVAVLPWYLVAMGMAIDLTFVLAPRVTPWLVARWPALDAYRARIVPAVAGMLAGGVLFVCLSAQQALHVAVPVTPLAALPFAALAGVAGVMIGSWVAAWMLERVPAVAHPASDMGALAASLRERLLSAIGVQRGL
jgi:hypothetical protein